MKEGHGSIIDIGANAGIYSLVAASMSPTSKVYAFEPHPLFFQWLSDNIKINHHLHLIYSFQVALGNFDGTSQIADYSQVGSSIEARISTFDTFAQQQEITSIKAIKVDIEGIEPEFIKGALKSIKKHRPYILIEVLTDEIGAEITCALKSVSYDLFHIHDDTGIVEKVARLEHRSGGRNFLLIPQGNP